MPQRAPFGARASRPATQASLIFRSVANVRLLFELTNIMPKKMKTKVLNYAPPAKTYIEIWRR